MWLKKPMSSQMWLEINLQMGFSRMSKILQVFLVKKGAIGLQLDTVINKLGDVI